MQGSLPVLLMTRPEKASRRFVQSLEQQAPPFRPVFSPVFAVHVTGPLPDSGEIAGLVFTSANAVRAWVDLGGRLDLPVFAVGRATAQAAQLSGMQAQSAGGAADDLVAMLIKTPLPGPLLHPHGQYTRGDVAKRLTDAGVPCKGARIYDQPAQPLTSEARDVLAGSDPVVLPVFSPRSGELIARQGGKAPLLVAALSEAVANTVGPLHKRDLKVARRPESEEMQKVVIDLLNRALTRDY